MPTERDAATTDQAPPILAAPELDAGMRLGDRYRLVARLGRGGGGAVWRAFDEKVGEDVALKLIDSGADLERWRREVALARRISHPNVCRVYDLGEAGGRRWVTMERIEGESLRVLLSRDEVHDRDRVMRQIVDAVAAIHAAGVVHRDLKPENIVVDRSGRAVIVDFGLARLPESLETTSQDGTSSPASGNVTKHGAVLGTPRYMAPEQAAGEVADARSDVYALGLVLEEISTCGEPGATASGADAMATTVSNGDAGARGADAAGSRVPLPRPWGAIVQRCVLRQPAARYADAVEVKAALAAHAPGRTRARWPYVAGGGAIVLATAAVAFVALARDRGGAHSEPGEVAVRRLTSTSAEPSTQPLSVALSPDGQTLAYTVGAELFTRPVDGGVASPVAMPTTAGGFSVARLAFVFGWSADGRLLVQLLERDDVWSIWVIGGAGRAERLHQGARRMSAAVSPRGEQLAVASMGDGLVVRPVAGGGAARVVVAGRPGENIGGPSWSPDGARLAFVRYAPDWSGDTLEVVDAVEGATARVLVRAAFANPVDQMTAWPSADRIIYGLNLPDAGTVMLVKLAGGAPIQLERWAGEYVGLGSWNAGRLAFLRGTGAYAIYVGTVDRRGYVLNLERAHPESVQARRLIGWTDEGQLVHTVDGDIVVRRPRGETVVAVGGADDDIPDTLVDGAILFHRAGAPGTHALWRAKVGGETRTLGVVPTEPASTNVVRCAGDRTTPCILEAIEGGTVRYERFDPVSGARGVVVHSMPLTGRYMRSFAVSPDGARMAVVDGSSHLVMVDLRDGTITREMLGASAELQSVTWSRAGDSVIVTMLGGGDELFNVVRVSTTGERQRLLHSNRRWFWRVHESPVDSRVAVQTRELALDVWLLDVVK